MALEFTPPPAWLMEEYVKRKQPAEVALEGINNALQTYAAMKQQEQAKTLQNQQMNLLARKEDREGREQFYNYGDVASLPKDVQTEMTAPVQGPVTEEGITPARPVSPIVQHFESFLKEYPQGIKGQSMTTDTILNPDGTIRTVQRPIKGRTIMDKPPYQAQRYNSMQQTTYTDEKGNPLAFIPSQGYVPAPTPGGAKPVLRKGDETAVNDVNLIAQQLPNVDKLFDAYKDKNKVSQSLQATPLGAVMDPQIKQMEDSLKLAAFTFGGKNLTANEKDVVFGALFPKWTDNDASRENKRQLLKDYFNGKIDLYEAANLLGPSGAPLREMLDKKRMGGGSGLTSQEQAELDALEKRFGGKP